MTLDDGYELATLLQHFGEEEKIQGAVVPPIFQNSLFVFDNYEEFFHTQTNIPAGPPYHYSRLGNPTLKAVQRKLAMLEGTEKCALVGTGMGAIALAIMSCVQSGSHVVALDTSYQPTRMMLADYLDRFGVSVTFVDGLCPESYLDAIRPETTLLYLESPGTGIFRLQDLEVIAKAAKEKGIATIIDNTYSTPLYQNPAQYGIDIIVHSGSKYLGGHSDINAGALCCSAERMDGIIRMDLNLYGSILSPFPAWLLHRGLRTLALRLKAHEASANTVAAWLEDHGRVERVYHVGLASNPQRALFQKQMRGSGGLFSFEPKSQDKAAILRFANACRLFQLGVSWGGFESLVMPLFMQPLSWPDGRYVIRLYCGLEDPRDLIKDLQLAFDESGL